VSSVLSKNVLERAAWTGLQALIALAVVYLGGISAWWAAPIALGLSAIKTNIVDRMAAPKAADLPPVTTEAGP